MERPAFAASGRLARTGSSFRRPRIANGPLFQWRSSEPRLLLVASLAQPPSLPELEINFSTVLSVLPTKCITYSVLPNACIWHYICTLDFNTHFKLVVFLGIRTGTSSSSSCQWPGPAGSKSSSSGRLPGPGRMAVPSQACQPESLAR